MSSWDPNQEVDCDKFYAKEIWKGVDELVDNELGDDEVIEWCVCTAEVPPGYPPPPPHLNMTYPCWYSDPGAE